MHFFCCCLFCFALFVCLLYNKHSEALRPSCSTHREGLCPSFLEISFIFILYSAQEKLKYVIWKSNGFSFSLSAHLHTQIQLQDKEKHCCGQAALDGRLCILLS